MPANVNYRYSAGIYINDSSPRDFLKKIKKRSFQGRVSALFSVLYTKTEKDAAECKSKAARMPNTGKLQMLFVDKSK